MATAKTKRYCPKCKKWMARYYQVGMGIGKWYKCPYCNGEMKDKK